MDGLDGLDGMRLQERDISRELEDSNPNDITTLPDTPSISLLSPELLTLIFDAIYHSFDDDPSNKEAQNCREKVFMTASHVCKSWRLMALGNALWWSKIDIRPTWNIEAITAYLERSKDCLLDLSLFGYVGLPGHANYTSSRHSLEDHRALLDLVFPYFHRCRRLQVRGFFYQTLRLPFHDLEKLLEAEMPNLEDFIFEGDLSFFQPQLSLRGSKPLFRSAPLLQNLGLLGVVIGRFCKPPLHLTCLHLLQGSNHDRTSFEDLKVVLETCCSLTTLAIYDDVLDDPIDGLTISVPSLQHLFILGNMFSVSELLLFLHAPNLTGITIAPVMDSDLEEFALEASSNTNLHKQHFPSLKSLTLAPAHYDTFDAVERASKCFPHIERLILANIYLLPFTKAFVKEADDVIIFPKLQDLALTSVDERHAKAIHDMQEFRIRKGHQLKNIYVDTESLARLKRYLNVSEPSSGAGHPDHAPFRLDLEEGNLWEVERRKVLFSEHKDAFIGSPASPSGTDD